MRRPKGVRCDACTPHDSAQSNLASAASTAWLYSTHNNLGCTRNGYADEERLSMVNLQMPRRDHIPAELARSPPRIGAQVRRQACILGDTRHGRRRRRSVSGRNEQQVAVRRQFRRRGLGVRGDNCAAVGQRSRQCAAAHAHAILVGHHQHVNSAEIGGDLGLRLVAGPLDPPFQPPFRRCWPQPVADS